MLAIEITPNLAAAQFLPSRQQRRLERLVARIARRNPPLWAAMQSARKAAQADQAAHDEWLCAQAPDLLPNTDYDLPW